MKVLDAFRKAIWKWVLFFLLGLLILLAVPNPTPNWIGIVVLLLWGGSLLGVIIYTYIYWRTPR